MEELGRAVDPTPYLATLTQFAPLAPAFAEPGRSGAAVLAGVSASHTADGWRLEGTARHVLDGDRADRFAVVTRAGVFVVPADRARAVRTPIFDPALHVAEVSFSGVPVTRDDISAVDPERCLDIALDQNATRCAAEMQGAV